MGFIWVKKERKTFKKGGDLSIKSNFQNLVKTWKCGDFVSSFLPVNSRLVWHSSCLLELGQVLSGPVSPLLPSWKALGVITVLTLAAVFPIPGLYLLWLPPIHPISKERILVLGYTQGWTPDTGQMRWITVYLFIFKSLFYLYSVN